MRAIVTATAILASGWVATILVGVANAKVMALVLGPAGLGLFAVLQSLARFAATLGGLGLSAGMVRIGTAEIAAGDIRGFEITAKAAWRIAMFAGAVVGLLGLVFAAGIARIVLGDSAQSRAIAVVALAVPITIASTVQMALINAHQRVSTLAKATSVGSLMGGVVGMLLVLLLGVSAIPLVVLSWAVGSWIASRLFQVPRSPGQAILPGEVAHRVRALLQFGLPYSFSTLAGETVQVAVPILVLHQLGTSGAGLYRAASSIAVAYLGFLLVALAQEYYPRLSAASEPYALARLTMDQQRFLLLVASPVIFLTMAFAPMILAVLYSSSFAGATGMLTWQLLGDLVRLPSWALAFVLLASGRSRTYFFAETAASLFLLLASWFAIGWLGLAGVGVAYMATYAAYYPLVWLLAARGVPALLSAEARRQGYWTAALICVGIVTITLPMLAPPAFRQLIAVAAPLLIGGICAVVAFNGLWPGIAQRLRLYLSRQYQ